jgi:hypothetical protein
MNINIDCSNLQTAMNGYERNKKSFASSPRIVYSIDRSVTELNLTS